LERQGTFATIGRPFRSKTSHESGEWFDVRTAARDARTPTYERFTSAMLQIRNEAGLGERFSLERTMSAFFACLSLI
jgi:hypothetical protein